MENTISYINKDFKDFREALIESAKQYYPEVCENLDDASIGSWLVDMVAGVADSLSYHIDRTYQETNVNTAQQTASMYTLARNNGVKIPSRRGSVAEIALTCTIAAIRGYENTAAQTKNPKSSMCPIVKQGTIFTNGSIDFELDKDIDFGKIADEDGIPNRTVNEIRDNADNITGYEITKHFLVTAGTSYVYKKEITKNNAVPFMEILLPYNNILRIDSIIFKEGLNYQVDPLLSDFFTEEEYTPAEYTSGKKDLYRFFEVESLADQYRWGKKVDANYTPITDTYGYIDTKTGIVVPTAYISRGEWKPLKQKFITEYTDKGYLNITFGAGSKYTSDDYTLGDASSYSKYLISRMVNNDALGVIPRANTTMYIRYRVGNGAGSNLPINSINRIKSLSLSFADCKFETENGALASQIRQSFKVTNVSPAIAGKDLMTGDELRNFIKYNKGAQDRCVTIDDYKSRILSMPSVYGSPFRVGVSEENNKIMVYLLSTDMNGKLTTDIPSAYIKNLEAYLSEYRMINDYVEMKAGRIVNLSFDIECYIKKSYSAADVTTRIVQTVEDYMSIDKHQMDDDIFLGDLQKEISSLDGVINVFGLRVYNEHGTNYSSTLTSQVIKSDSECCSNKTNGSMMNCDEIDLEASDYILYADGDTMLEIKYPEKDIRVSLKVR